MTYATAEQLIAAFPQQDLVLLTDRSGAPDAIDTGRVTSALEDATAQIDGYIAKRVKLPLADPPRMLAVVCRDLAIHRIYANGLATVPETVKALNEAAVMWLKMVARGDLSIGDETSGDEVQTSPGVVLTEGEPPAFTRDTLKGF